MKALALAFVLLLAACNPWSDWEEANAVFEDPAKLTTIGGLALPKAATSARETEARPRILIKKGAIHVDTTAVWTRLPPGAREALKIRLEDRMDVHTLGPKPKAIALNGWGPPVTKDGSMLIEPLFEALGHIKQLRRATAGLRDGLEHSQPEYDRLYEVERALSGVSILADADTPMPLLVKVIYTAGQAEFSTFDLIANHKGQPRALRIEAPRYCGQISRSMLSTRLEQALDFDPCLTYSATDTEVGWHITTAQSNACGVLKPSVGQKLPDRPAYHDKIQTTVGGQCPAVPHGASTDVRAALEHALGPVDTKDALCAAAHVSAREQTSLQSLVEVLSALSARGFKHAQLGFGTRPSADILCTPGTPAPIGIKGRQTPSKEPDRKPQ